MWIGYFAILQIEYFIYSRPSLIRKVWDQKVVGLVKCSDYWSNEYHYNNNEYHYNEC